MIRILRSLLRLFTPRPPNDTQMIEHVRRISVARDTHDPVWPYESRSR